MIPLYVAAAACLAVWFLVAARRGWIRLPHTISVPVVACGVVIIGGVCGPEFWSRRIGPLPLSLDRVLWGLMLLELARQWSLGRWRLGAMQPTDWLVAALLLLLLVSTLTHDFRYRDNLPLSRLLFFNLMPAGIYLAARCGPVTDRDLRTIAGMLGGFSVYLALTGIAEWRGWEGGVFPRYISNPLNTEFLGRARGPFLNPIVNGTFLTVGLTALAWSWPRLASRRRWLWSLIVATIVLGVYATLTRSVWIVLALCAGGIGWSIASTRARGGLLVAGACGIAGLLVLAGGELNSFKRDRFVSEAEMSESAALRPLLAQVAWKMFLDKPVTGHGFGQYTQAKRLYHQQVTTEPLKKAIPYMQHNVVLSYLTETGVLGVGLLLGIWLTFAQSAWRLLQTGWRSTSGLVGLLSLVMLACYVVNGMFHDVSIMPSIGSLYYLLLGLATQLASGARLPQMPSVEGQHVTTE